MAEVDRCPSCGKDRPPDSPEGPCPTCQIRQAFRGEALTVIRDVAPMLAAGPATGPWGASALERLADPAGPLRRFRLSADGSAPEVDTIHDGLPDGERGSDRYVLGVEIARGDTWVAFAASDVDLGRDIVVKMLQSQHRRTPGAVRRFVEGAQVAAQLQHPGVIPVFELGALADRRPYLTTMPVEGDSLAARLSSAAGRDHDPAPWLRVVEQVAQTVAYAHSRGVVHGNLSAGTVVVGDYGEVYVAEWGRGRLSGYDDGDGAADTRSDVAALGLLLAAALTGAQPASLSDTRARLDASAADPGLRALAARCLAPDPSARPGDAGEVANGIAAYFAGLARRLDDAEQSRSDAEARASAEATRAETAEEAACRERRNFRIAACVAGLMVLPLGLALAARRAPRPVAVEAAPVTGEMLEAPPVELALLRSRDDSVVRASADAEPRAGGSVDEAQARDLTPTVRHEIPPLSSAGHSDDTPTVTVVQAPEPTAAPDPLRAPDAVEVRVESTKLVPEGTGSAYERGVAQLRSGQPAEAAAAFREALQAGSPTAAVWLGLGDALSAQGQYGEAADAYREASRIKPDDPAPVAARARALASAGQTDEALAEYGEAARLAPGDAEVQNRYGVLLFDQARDTEKALAAFREAVRLKPDYAEAHFNLGNAHRAGGRLDEALAETREAVRLRPDYAEAHVNLGILERAQGSAEVAVAEYREAIRINPELAEAHLCLGHALLAQGKPGEAVAPYREAVRLRPDDAEAHCQLATALQAQGDYASAVQEFRAGHEIGSRRPGWPHPSADWVREAERLSALADRLPAALRGDELPDPETEIQLARIAAARRLHVGSARLSRDAFRRRGELADDLASGARFAAARSAALAGAGRGDDAPPPDEKDRVRWRQQAIAWLRADLDLTARLLKTADPSSSDDAETRLGRWQRDPDLSPLRDGPDFDGLTEAERAACRDLWVEVERVRLQAAGVRSP
jgi:serine/threonine-protein kinase